MEYNNDADLWSRLKSVEIGLAYTLTAISGISPGMKDNVVKALRKDATLNTTDLPEFEKALSNLADLIESFKLNN